MKHHILPLLLALVIATGCSNKLPLSGTVTFSDNGEPVPLGVVYFVTPTFQAQGAIQEDGRYVVGSDKVADGLPPGTYQVYIAGAATIEVRQMRPPGQVDPNTGENIDRQFTEEISTSLIDLKYTNPDTSGLTFTVERGARTFDFEVDRAR
ncbi:MAG: hypothetical protein FWG73_07110 [Planctomycetaceae bacterium]|nr:hypothetical protein [Planctomycetaceae bacterium]